MRLLTYFVSDSEMLKVEGEKNSRRAVEKFDWRSLRADYHSMISKVAES